MGYECRKPTSRVREVFGVQNGRVEDGSGVDRNLSLTERLLDSGLENHGTGRVDAEQQLDQANVRVDLLQESVLDRLITLSHGAVTGDEAGDIRVLDTAEEVAVRFFALEEEGSVHVGDSRVDKGQKFRGS